jgi:RNA-directed DNA polymerase
VPAAAVAAGRLEKAMSRESDMHAGGESDGCVVPTKGPNKGGRPPAEGLEGRRPSKENIGQATAPRTQSRISELSDLLGVRKAARKDKRTRFTALLHLFCSGRGGQRSGSKLDPLNHAATCNSRWKSRRA